ncbi:Oidioi.mRNA.OKI2018_I69.chr1.g958.t1.cds [Oikopleura dioica]|uniref:Oidioi.mRNA.OKI2018_I69.chr1.g958.t1.cds n=1 Tax=Oikopleura dioica TaxID=34765 RepID=A0ABN7SQ41_OIKDI|nr:Oidioi.mRNA.OKI2018_I69.chr1.g958.t1.cds [Oikopleura dioica]
MSKVANIGKLKNYTVFITGASRGIGLSMAKKIAADGANIVVAAKTAEPHPKLPGTIYTAAEEIEAAGGRALPMVVDVRDEKSVDQAVAAAVGEFGGIDILINNASAISLTDTQSTGMKRYDLMHSINGRGTYMLSHKCVPHLLESKDAGREPHILNNSPPLDMRRKWFENHVAYTIAKMNMSLCAHGMAGEFEGDIAVNCIWPRTAIWTAAMKMLGGDQASAGCRLDTIMSDCAYGILTKGTDFTGNFVVDQEFLEQEYGITDFSSYRANPDQAEESLINDFFLPERFDKYNSENAFDKL